MASPSASNTVLFQMVLQLQSQLKASEDLSNQLRQEKDFLAGQLALEQSFSRQLTLRVQDAQWRIRQQFEGANILTVGLDALYILLGRLRDVPEVAEHRDHIQRIMLRADVGYAIVQGAPFVDMTANEDLDETETEGEEEEDDEALPL